MAATSQRLPYRNIRGKPPGPHPGYSTRVGGGKDHFTPHPMSSQMSTTNLPGVYSNPDMAYALVAVLGFVVDVQLKSGTVFQGVLKAVSPKLSIALALAHNKAKELTRTNTERLMQLEFADIISISVLPDMNPTLGSKDIFKTDAEIGRSNGSGFAKSFQPFAFDDDATAMITLDESSGWSAEDMFETNKSKFNVESSYDEEMTDYTTKLDRSDTKDFRDREERAKQLAREIEADTETHRVDDQGTEEEQFSAVMRQEVAPPPSSRLGNSKAPSTSSPIFKAPSHVSGPKPPGLVPVSVPPGLSSSSSSSKPPPGLPNSHHHPPPPHSSGPSYSSVVNTPDVRQSAKAPPPDCPPGSGGTNSSQTDVSSSQECHQTPSVSADMDCMNAKGGWSTEESALSPSDENSSDWPECETLDKYSQESGRQGERGVVISTDQLVTSTSPAEEDMADLEVPEAEATPPVEASHTPQASTPIDSEKEKKVQTFKLNPNAKMFTPETPEFVPSGGTSLPGSPLTQSSSSPALLDSYQPPSSSSSSSSFPKKYPKPRRHTPSAPQFVPDYASTAAVAAAAAGGYVYSAPHMPAANPALVRGSLQQVPAQQMIQYSSSLPQFAPQYPAAAAAVAGGFMGPQQAVTAQQLVNAGGQKYIGDLSPQHFAGTQQPFPMHMAPQLMQQPAGPHGQLMASASQPQLSSTLVNSPTPVMFMQSGMSGLSPTAPGGVPGMYSHVQVMPQVGQSQALAQNRFLQQQPPPN